MKRKNKTNLKHWILCRDGKGPASFTLASNERTAAQLFFPNKEVKITKYGNGWTIEVIWGIYLDIHSVFFLAEFKK